MPAHKKGELSRAKSRELSFQILYRCAFNNFDKWNKELSRLTRSKIATKELLEWVWGAQSEDEAIVKLKYLSVDAEYFQNLFQALSTHAHTIDQRIETQSVRPLRNLDPVCLTLCRVAICEVLYLENAIPVSIAIDEAVRLGKKYGEEDSHRYLTGMLDALFKSQ